MIEGLVGLHIVVVLIIHELVRVEVPVIWLVFDEWARVTRTSHDPTTTEDVQFLVRICVGTKVVPRCIFTRRRYERWRSTFRKSIR